MIKNIIDIECCDNKIVRLYTKNSNKNGITWETYVKSFIKRHKFDGAFVDFVKKGKKDILKSI
jgi:hypothetical protein